MSRLTRKKKSCFVRSRLKFSYMRYTYLHWANWAIDGRNSASLYSSHLRPSTNTIPLHQRPRVHETIRGMKKPKNESDVKLRPDWFTSEATSLQIFVGRAGSTVGNLSRFAREKYLLFSIHFSSSNAPILNKLFLSKLRQERQNYSSCEEGHNVV